MNLENAKGELVKRYKYLYGNAFLILAPYMYEETSEELVKRLKEQQIEFGTIFADKPLIYLNISRLDGINSLFEEFLLSDIPMEESKLYQLLQSKKNNKEYLEQVSYGLALLEKENADKRSFPYTIDIFKILSKTCDYIEEQSGDLNNKKNKLNVLDEYYRIGRYKNNGKIYTSGRNLDLHDCDSLSFIIDKNPRKPLRDKNDVGVKNNSFITAIVTAPHYEDNLSIFTENEKQQVYLTYHDELPCNLEIACALEEVYIHAPTDTRLQRPKNTEPCGEYFTINENEIFVDPNDSLYRYYQMCPHCGYIVNIPKEILSDGIKERIEDRCSKDNKLFRKMYLYSELYSLDKSSTKGQKRILQK